MTYDDDAPNGGPATATADHVRVLIAEDDPSLREAIAELIDTEPGFDLVAAVGDTDAAIAVAAEALPDVALVDVKMPGGGGQRATREIRDRSPATRVVVLSAYEDRRTVLEMLQAGAVGYMVKGTPADQIVETIHRSMRGQGALSVEVTADVIHELTSLLERSESLSRELQALNRTKSELMQILSHELLTPLTIIQGFATTIADRWDSLHRSEVAEMAGSVAAAGQRLQRLIGNLSAASRLEREGQQVTTRPVPVAEIVDEALERFPGETERIVVEPAGSDVRALADHRLAATSVALVLENALSFSDRSGRVNVSVSATASEVRIAVSDRGPGVPAELRERVFDAFTQVDGSTTRTHEGLGIGLYLARRIMDHHGGSIGLRDRKGGGSTFVLSFPRFDPVRDADRDAPAPLPGFEPTGRPR
jgi:signal transduction histidine kinase